MRELDNVLQRALILQPGTLIDSADLHLQAGAIPLQLSSVALAAGDEPRPAVPTDNADNGSVLGQDLRQREYQLILDALQSCGGSRKDAAEKLGISPRTLRYKLARMREEGIMPGGE